MDKFVVKGGVPLRGQIETGGAKNSALPALAATLLTDQPVVLRRIPHVRDVRTMQRLLVDIGATAEVDNGCLRIQVRQVRSPEAPYELVKTMRASSLVLGPLVARAGRARVSLPGGCAIGARPLNLHLTGLEQLGAQIRQSHGYIEAEAPQGLRRHGLDVSMGLLNLRAQLLEPREMQIDGPRADRAPTGQGNTSAPRPRHQRP